MKTQTVAQSDVLDHLLRVVDRLNDNLVKTQQRKLPALVNESGYTPSDTSLTVSPQYRSAIIVKTIIVQCTSAATLTLGKHSLQIPSAQSPFSIGGLTWIINQDEVRNLTQTSAGFMSLEICGESLGDIGVL